jgi:hypothetical protein
MVSLPLHGEIYVLNGDNIVAFQKPCVLINISMGVMYTCMGSMYLCMRLVSTSNYVRLAFIHCVRAGGFP